MSANRLIGRLRLGVALGVVSLMAALLSTPASFAHPSGDPPPAAAESTRAPLLVEQKGPEGQGAAAAAAPPNTDPANLEGIWKADHVQPLVQAALGTTGPLVTVEGTEPPYTAEGQNIFWHRILMEQRGTPVANTAALYLPSIPLNSLSLDLDPFTLLQTRDQVVVLWENGTAWQIYLNKPQPHHLKPTYRGHSVGHWEGATLVVDSSGFNTRTWLDSHGSPHSADLRFITRISKIHAGRQLEFLTTFDDPKFYREPFTVRRTATWRPDLHLLEVEIENTRDENNEGLVYEDGERP
ncbi:MAG: hypothetical protein JWL65_7144, partial [Gammaproteobacteria bacterium]|nr:hypothetical protein [Gammaproteobacteria bacterium]